MDKTTIIEAIQEFCENNESRKRNDLYDFLNEELGLGLDASEYDKTRFDIDASSQKWEADYILNILGDDEDEEEEEEDEEEEEEEDEDYEYEYEKTRRNMRNMRNMRNYN